MSIFKKLKRELRHLLVPTEVNKEHPYLLRAELLIFLLTVVLVSQAVIFAPVLRTKVLSYGSVEEMLAAILPSVLVAETNQYRTDNKVAILNNNPTLTLAATMKAEDMAKKGYFSHVGPNNEKPWIWLQKAGYDYEYAGENLAVDFTDSQDVTTAWINSPKHQENLISANYKDIGIGTANGTYQGRPTTFVVQFFASPAEKLVVKDTLQKDLAVATLVAKKAVGKATSSLAVIKKTLTVTADTMQDSTSTATSTATTTGDSVLTLASTTATNTADGIVLGTFTDNNQQIKTLSLGDLLSMNLALILISPKESLILFMGIIALALIVVIGISMLYTLSKTKREYTIERIEHMLMAHKKILLLVMITLIVLFVLSAVDTFLAGGATLV